MSVELDPYTSEVMAGDETPIFLATLDEEGRPNCVPVVTIVPYENGDLIFGDFMLNKTRHNLAVDQHIGIAMFNAAFEGWSLKGTFLRFETVGPGFDFLNRTPMFRYNAYTGVSAAGFIRPEEVSEKMKPSKAALGLGFLRAKLGAMLLRGKRDAEACMPLPVEEKFGRLSAVRALAFKDSDGYPRAFPMLSCLAAGPNRLVIADTFFDRYAAEIPVDSEVAICVLTLEAVSYQVKGLYRGKKAGVSVIDLTECYSASPPLVGDRLDGSGAGSTRVSSAG